MAESSDPILLTKTAQKISKGADGAPGIFIITRTKIKWMPDEGSNAKPFVLQLSAITRKQQISGKPLLRLLGGAEPLVLSFTSEQDRDEALEFLKQLEAALPSKAAPSGRTNANSFIPSAEHRQRLFSKDKDLEILYGQLVASSVLSEEDFWRARTNLLDKQGGSSSGGASTSHRQRTGLSSVMHEVERLHDGQTEKVNVTLSTNDIQRIFTEKPEVHQAFLANVPHALSEQDFWAKYFVIELKRTARRKKLAAAGRLDADEDLDEGDDLFAPFRKKIAAQDRQKAIAQLKAVDPTVNLAAEFADRFALDVHAGGGADGAAPSTFDSKVVDTTSNTTAIDHHHHIGGNTAANNKMHGLGGLKELARDMNKHAALVLEGTPDFLVVDSVGEKKGSSSAEIAAKVAAAVQAAQKAQLKEAQGAIQGDFPQEMLEDWKRRAISALDDLAATTEVEVVPLNIDDPRVYFANDDANGGGLLTDRIQQQHAKPSSGGGDNNKKQHKEEEQIALLKQSIAKVNPVALTCPPCDGKLASSVLQELARDSDETLVSKFGAAAASAALGSVAGDVLGGVMLEYFRMEALKTNELLRHFWGCMPLTSSIRKDKAAKLSTHLESQRKELMAHSRANPGTAQQVYVAHMVQPLIQSIDAALDKYDVEHRAAQKGKATIAS